MQIHDDYFATGKDYESFVKELASFTENTDNTKLPNYKFKLLSFQRTDGDKYIFALIDESAINNFSNFITPLPKVTLTPKPSERPFFDEMTKTSGLVLLDEDDNANSMLMVSKDAVPSLADRAGIKGDLIQKYSLIRNLYIAQGLFSPFERVNPKKFESAIVYRKQYTSDCRCIKKAFAFMGNRFVYTSLAEMKNIADKIISSHPYGKTECLKWTLCHRNGTLFLEFPEKAKELKKTYALPDTVIPGICISDSDIGRQSLIISSTFRFEKSKYVQIYDQKAWEHTSDMKFRDILEYIFVQFPQSFEELVAALQEKTQIPVKKEKIARTYDAFIKEAQFVKAIGKKRTTALSKHLSEEVLSKPKTCPKTEYACIKKLVFCGELFDDIPEYAKDNLSEACGRLPFISRKGISMKWED